MRGARTIRKTRRADVRFSLVAWDVSAQSAVRVRMSANHVATGGHGLETELRIQAVGVASSEHEAAQPDQLRVTDHALDQPLAQPSALVLLDDEHVAQP